MSDIQRRRAFFFALLGGFILLLVMGARQALGLYLEPISTSLSLGRESFAFSVAIANLFWGLGAPFTGSLSDRYGAMPVIMVGALSYAIGLTILAMASNSFEMVIAGVFIGIGLSAAGFTVVLGSIGKLAPSDIRDKVLTFASVGSALGLWLAIPFAKTLIDVTTISISLFILSAVIACIFFLAIPFRSTHIPAGDAQPITDDRYNYLKHSLQNQNYLLLLAGFFICGFHVAFVALHLPAFLEDKTSDASVGATALALIGFANVFGTLAAGYTGEIFGKARTLSGLYFIRFFLYLGFWLLPMTEMNIYILSLLTGFFWLGTVPLTSGLVAALYGTKWLSMMFGIVFLSHQVGAFIGSWMGGRVFDITQSYDLMWITAASLALLSGLLHLPIREDYAAVEVAVRT